MIQLAKYLKPYSLSIAALMLLLFAQANCDLALPGYMARIVNVGIQQVSTAPQGFMLRVGGEMLLIALLSALAQIASGYLSASVSTGIARDIRSAVFAKAEGFSQREFDRFSTASLITRANNDVLQVQMIVVVLARAVVYPPILGVGGIVHALGMNASMWWIIAAPVAMLVILVGSVFALAVPKFRASRGLIDRLTLVARERLSGLLVTRAFNREAGEEERFDEANQDLRRNTLFVNRTMLLLMPSMMLIMNGVSVLIAWVGARQIAASAMRVGDVMAFMQYALQILIAFLMMSGVFIMLPSAAVSAGRVAEVLATESSLKDPARPKSIAGRRALDVEFSDLRFRYPGAEEEVLRGVSFTAEAGATTAIIGPTGAGKSSLVSLIPRLYDASSGSVRIGGVDARGLSQEELRASIGYVAQKASLFSGTIESNLRFAKEDATKAELERALRMAQLGDFVETRAGGLAAEIAQGGVNVSGGQRQRLAIARALVKDPRILVFDDSLSALDFRTDSALRSALRREMGDRTVIMVTQRAATALSADKIVVLDEGLVAGVGDHKSLMRDCPTYREIALSQLGAEVAA